MEVSRLLVNFLTARDRLKAVARRMPDLKDTDALIDCLAEQVLQRYVDSSLDNLETALILDFMGHADWPDEMD